MERILSNRRSTYLGLSGAANKWSCKQVGVQALVRETLCAAESRQGGPNKISAPLKITNVRIHKEAMLQLKLLSWLRTKLTNMQHHQCAFVGLVCVCV